MKRAEDTGLVLMITMGLDETSTAVVLKLAKRHPSARAYARRCEKLGIHLSLGLRTLQAPPPGFEAAVKYMPMRLIVIEPDSNKPWEVVKACEIIARIKGLTVEEVGSTATENLRRLTHL